MDIFKKLRIVIKNPTDIIIGKNCPLYGFAEAGIHCYKTKLEYQKTLKITVYRDLCFSLQPVAFEFLHDVHRQVRGATR